MIVTVHIAVNHRDLRLDIGRARRSVRMRSRRLVSQTSTAGDLLSAARARSPLQAELPDRFSTIGAGLEQTYRDGRRALKRALESHAPADLHTLRRRVKDHWYQVRLLRSVAPDLLDPHAGAIEKLSDLLGEHHDLTLLRDSLDRKRFDRLLRFVAKRWKHLEERGLSLAQLVFAEEPQAWRNRMRAYWRLRPDT